MTLLLFCHEVAAEPTTSGLLWPLALAAGVGVGFTTSLIQLLRELKGGRRYDRHGRALLGGGR